MLTRIITRTAEQTANEIIRKLHLKKDIITYAELKAIYGIPMSREIRMSPNIKWHPYGKGSTTSGTYCMKKDVEKYLMNKELKRY